MARQMMQLVAQPHKLDRIAMAVSGLCLVHCLGTAVALAMLASAGGMLGAHIIHEVGLGLAIILGALAIGRGAVEHGYLMPVAVAGVGLGVMAGALQLPHDGGESLYTMLGAAILALGHRLNFIASE